jgi:tRNA pseudouridine32 synthase / 23S rRNA pseudouridine746 synthase
MLLARLLYRDAMMLVIDKPAGLPVHAGPKGGDNIENYFEALRFGLPRLPGLAHRLDRETSGCLILGRHRQALARLGKAFQHGKIEKTYLALVNGVPVKKSGRINAPLAKQTTDKRQWWMQVDVSNGQTAITDYTVLSHTNTHSVIEFYPRTGRTHQIRVHSAHLGCALVGDKAYGIAGDTAALMLHARAVTIPLYPNKPAITVTAPIPAHIAEMAIQLGLML